MFLSSLSLSSHSIPRVWPSRLAVPSLQWRFVLRVLSNSLARAALDAQPRGRDSRCRAAVAAGVARKSEAAGCALCAPIE